ncbi:MaoC family dehydratase [Caulobacter sp. S45]|uniref:MaoC family dehydratase n=1 Tax=Caulobacter sp. S45 TaxID=1641861 RepID=UPI001574EFD3|nr:MaoC family dehydratase [Caulobacter sp. S45]
MTETPLKTLQAEVGRTYVSEWILVDQAMIDRFAEVTGDHQFIHVDPERAAQTPFGGTVAHGFLLLSLLPRLQASMGRPRPEGLRMAVNYGFERVRFVTPVRSGSRVRATSTLVSVEEKRPGQLQQLADTTLEVEGAGKPALTAVWIGQLFF